MKEEQKLQVEIPEMLSSENKLVPLMEKSGHFRNYNQMLKS